MAQAGQDRRSRVPKDELRSHQARGMGAGLISKTLHLLYMTIWHKLKEA